MLKYFYTDYAENGLKMIYEQKIEFIPKISSNQFLELKCKEQGCTVESRRLYYKEKMNLYKFIPIVLHQYEIYLPISNIKKYDCIWVNYFAIQEIQEKKKECIIYFKDDTFLISSYGKRVIRTINNLQKYCIRYL